MEREKERQTEEMHSIEPVETHLLFTLRHTIHCSGSPQKFMFHMNGPLAFKKKGDRFSHY